MPVFNNDGSNNKQFKKIFANTGTMNKEIKEAYAWDGTVNRLVFKNEIKANVTVRNYSRFKKDEGWPWSEITGGDATENLYDGTPTPSGRYWFKIQLWGWHQWGEAHLWVYAGGNTLIDDFQCKANFPTEPEYSSVVNGIYNTPFPTWRLYRPSCDDPGAVGALQGACRMAIQPMIVPVKDIEDALGQQVTATQMETWCGSDWTGSKNITAIISN